MGLGIVGVTDATWPGRRAHPDRWRERLLLACRRLESGEPEQVTCLRPMRWLCSRPDDAMAFLRFLLDTARHDPSLAFPEAHPAAPGLVDEVLGFIRLSARPVGLPERREARALAHRLFALQPDFKRVWAHATRRRGKDSRLLMAERVLSALYGVIPFPSSWDEHLERNWDESEPMGIVSADSFCEAIAYFVAHWADYRFRMDRSSAVRIRLMLDWWSEERGAVATG